MNIRKPYLLFLGDVREQLNAKTAFGLRDWTPEDCVGQLRTTESAVNIGLPDMSPTAAISSGARTLVIGTSSPGGRLDELWRPTLEEALRVGLDIASGLHFRFRTDVRFAELANDLGRTLHDIRYNSQAFPIGTGERRTGRRLLTVGADCASGKKYTALSIAKAMAGKGMNVDFRATGQTGILISGRGTVVDTVEADFIAGAAEELSPSNDPDHWDIIEGQGSILHPSYAGVSLGLLHGSQPDALVVCHDPFRQTLNGFPHRPYSRLEEVLAAHLCAGRLTNPEIRLVGISMNTSGASDGEGAKMLDRVASTYGLPCVDPLRTGVEEIVTVLEKF